MRCYGTIGMGDCDREAIATAASESTLTDREQCAYHLTAYLDGSCGKAAITYYDGRKVLIGWGITKVGQTFDTPFEQGCTVLTLPDENEQFIGWDSERVEVDFTLRMVRITK